MKFNPGDIVRSKQSGRILRVNYMEGITSFNATVLASLAHWSIGTTSGGWDTSVFELHLDYARLKKLEKIFANLDNIL